MRLSLISDNNKVSEALGGQDAVGWQFDSGRIAVDLLASTIVPGRDFHPVPQVYVSTQNIMETRLIIQRSIPDSVQQFHCHSFSHVA